MKNKKTRRILFWLSVIAVLAWMILIFMLSAQESTESAEVSGRVSYQIVKGVDRMFHLEMTDEEIVEKAQWIDFPVRKGAHMSEYAILAVLVLAAATLGQGEEKSCRRLYRYGGAFVVAFAYAGTDEFHQRFVPGRAGRITDVLIDSCGAGIGLLLVFLFVTWYNHHRKKRKKG